MKSGIWLGCAVFAGAVHAQSFLMKPLGLVVGIAPGGGLDASRRIVANGLSKNLGQQMVMESFKTEIGLQIVHIPYKGAAAYVPDLVAGVQPIAVISVTAALAQRIRIGAQKSGGIARQSGAKGQ